MYYGIHINKGSYKSLEDAIEHAVVSWSCGQIFTHGPRSYKRTKINEDAIRNLAMDFPLFVHSSYLSKPWDGSATALDHINDQLQTARNIGARGLVVHLPKATPEVVARYMPKFNAPPNCPIILEMPSMHPSDRESYETPEKINNLIEVINKGPAVNFGICIDTAHLWAAGVSLSSYGETVTYLGRLKYPSKISLFHLNGTDVEFNGGRDVHIIIGTHNDKIWGKVNYYDSGIRAILEFCKKYNIPIILEINRGEESEILNIGKLLAQWTAEIN